MNELVIDFFTERDLECNLRRPPSYVFQSSGGKLGAAEVVNLSVGNPLTLIGFTDWMHGFMD
jgi:hypothetical protein